MSTPTETVSTPADALRGSAAAQAELVRSGDVSARELVEASLEAIGGLDPALRAFVALGAEDALAAAERVRPGDPRPLCGVPFAAKDLLGATRGLPTTHGTDAFGDWIADHDTAHIRRLRDAGAILVGKTASPELGARPVTESERYGTTRNPWNPELSSGGSSGGSAAAVAAGMVAFADGSDQGGSIRMPAACCGVLGMKPSRGRVSIGPDFGDFGAGTASDGAVARTALDLALVLDAMSGYEPGDHHFISGATGSFRTYAAAAASTPAPVRVRLALTAPLGVPVGEEPRLAAERTAESLAELGHDVREGVPDWDDDGFPAAWGTFATGMLQHFVVLLERLHGRPADGERLSEANRAWFVDSDPVPLVDYLEAVERLVAFSRRVLTGWPSDEVLVTPTLTRLPATVAELRAGAGVTDAAVRFSAFTRIFNVTGQPAISVPFHATDGGVPVGVQLVAAPGREDLLIGLAAQLERAVGWSPQAPAPPVGLAAWA